MPGGCVTAAGALVTLSFFMLLFVEVNIPWLLTFVFALILWCIGKMTQKPEQVETEAHGDIPEESESDKEREIRNREMARMQARYTKKRGNVIPPQ